MKDFYLKGEEEVLSAFLPNLATETERLSIITERAKRYIDEIRRSKKFGMESFMSKFNLSTEEGAAIISLAEGLLRVPDYRISLELAFDKLSEKKWSDYLKEPGSFKAFATSFGLYFGGLFSDFAENSYLGKVFSKLGSPLFLKILKEAVKYSSSEFVFAPSVEKGLKKIGSYDGYRFSFDILGESTRTAEKAEEYYASYLAAIKNIGSLYKGRGDSFLERPNLSVKFTALYPRFEWSKKKDLDEYLIPKLIELVRYVAKEGLSVTFDAEEARRLDLYLYVISRLIEDPSLKDFEGIGFVLQAYQTRAYEIIGYVLSLAKKTGKKIPLRLVKGAYWDYEIKYAQERSAAFYPVFTKKIYTDASYLACAKKIFESDGYIFPQLATHNALTASYIEEIGEGKDFEFQKLYGMGDILHENLLKAGRKVRIYSPVGETAELLPYLMRRMLENGANSSFVHKIAEGRSGYEGLVYDLYEKTIGELNKKGEPASIPLPKNIYPDRENPLGLDLDYKKDYEELEKRIGKFSGEIYKLSSIIGGKENFDPKKAKARYRPGANSEIISEVTSAERGDIEKALEVASSSFDSFSVLSVEKKIEILNKIGDLYEENKFKLYSILIREAGKSPRDAISEVIESIDFCRYYALRAQDLFVPRKSPSVTGEENITYFRPRGLFLCISPWNFPLAIFTGQIVAALVTGNVVIAKPADQTQAIAHFAVKLMYEAGLPPGALQLLLTPGSLFGEVALSSGKIDGIVFTGSTDTARLINKTLADRSDKLVPIIAETGGQNAMVVDSSALFEQVTDDVLSSAFYSAGQRCSALRILYLQEEIYEPTLKMVKEATALLKIGDSADFASDVGPLIDAKSFSALSSYLEEMESKGFKIFRAGSAPENSEGYFFRPAVVEISSIKDLPEEKFGPILHVIKYKSGDLDRIIEEIDSTGYGLTFGIHSRIEKKIDYIVSRIKAGNIYVNRSTIGAKVESQPFGGENKSGTGFKAGGPNYLTKFVTERTVTKNLTAVGGNIELLGK